MTPPLFTWSELTLHTGGRWLGFDTAAHALAGISCIVTDSRETPPPGALFLALKGERFDAHSFLAQAVERGAAAVCAMDLPLALETELARLGAPVLLVDDTLVAYGLLARAHRRRFPDLPVIAVTGSSGKTSTKEIIGAVLRRHFDQHVLTTEGNTNNLVGLPRNLLRLTAQDRAAVLELGTSWRGEIARLAAIAEPTIGIVTNVGPVHLEGLGDLDGVADEKSDLFVPVAARPHGWCILPQALRHHPRVAPKLPPGRTFGVALAASGESTTGASGDVADLRVTYFGGDLAGSHCRIDRPAPQPPLELHWSMTGPHQCLNAAAAVAVAGRLGVPDATIVAALANLHLPGMRMRRETVNDVTWLNDAYNANPDSMRALLDVLRDAGGAPGATLYVALGDMLELGPTEDSLHRDLLTTALARLPDAVLIPVGPRMVRAAADLGLAAWPTVEAARLHLLPRLRPGDTVALKASRGMALERLVPPA